MGKRGEILYALRQILNDDEWKSLPSLIREKRNGMLRESARTPTNYGDTVWKAIEKREKKTLEGKLREEQQQKEREQDKSKKEQGVRQFQKERKLREEQRARQKQKALEPVTACFESDFLRADSVYDEKCSAVISREEYDTEKTNFVQSWAKNNTKSGLLVDKEQAKAISSYGAHVQVVARAGSGKTTTLVNRAIFLQEHCRIPPNQIMLLAFNKKAVKEIEKRLKKYFSGLKEHCHNEQPLFPHVMTFHALAYRIVHPEEPLLYGEPKSRSIQSVIDDYLRDPGYKDKIRALMLNHFRADWERIVEGGYGKEKGDFIEYRRSLPNVGLGGEYLKSYGEKLIADFLFEHDIRYQYENFFWWKGINYRPDFTVFLTAESGIIIEYFGLSGDSDYDEQTKEKREYWKSKKSWKLLEITPKDVCMGREQFFLTFKQKLSKKGVPCTPLPEDEIWRRIKDRAIDGFTEAARGFIERCRKLSYTPKELNKLIHSRSDLSSVEEQFLEIAQHLYGAYLDRLNATGEDDFDGLMQRAVNNISEGQTIFESKSGRGDLKEIRYIFIDEYQDFSDLFFKLVDATREKNDRIEFFCIGDEWQAINRFAGSDLKFYKNFQQYFSPSCELHLHTNYRSSKSIVELGNALMEGLGEPSKTDKSDNGTILLVDLKNFTPSNRENERHAGDKITPAVLRLISKLLSDDKNVVLLSRTNTFKKNELDSYSDKIRSYFPEELRDRISTSTVHKYKGLEKGAVIILDAVLRRYPLIHPDWIFTRILGDDIEGIISEEKRLFYVALTRAKDTLIILTQEPKAPFLQDITSRITLDCVDWDSYPSVKDENRRLTVQVVGDTYSIRGLLKASGYRWDARIKIWQKSFLEEGFSPKTLKNSIWAEVANEIGIRIVDNHDSLVGAYAIHSGQWKKIHNYKTASNIRS